MLTFYVHAEQNNKRGARKIRYGVYLLFFLFLLKPTFYQGVLLL